MCTLFQPIFIFTPMAVSSKPCLFCLYFFLLWLQQMVSIQEEWPGSFFSAAQYSVVWLCHHFFAPSLVDGHVGYFQA